MGSIQVVIMFYDHYVIAPEFIRREIGSLVEGNTQLQGIKTSFFLPSSDKDNECLIFDAIKEMKCDNDILLLCDASCPPVSVPDDYCGSLKVSRPVDLYNMFAGDRRLQEHKDAGAFITIPGWLESWQHDPDGMLSSMLLDGSFSERYSSILILDTGLYPSMPLIAKRFSEQVGVPFSIMDVGIEHFKLEFDNMVLQWSIEKKQDQLKVCNRKAASYAMSIDFIKTIADLTDEATAIDSICKLFSTMFAPKNVVYYSFHENEIELKYCKSPESEKELIMNLRDSDSNYVVFDKEDGFAIKILAAEDLLGIIEIHGVAFPEYLDEYLSVGYDLAKASGLAISNIRRYHELFRSREEHVKLTETLRTTNRILRHDIANDLQIVLGALDLLEENYDEKFLLMIRKAANKSASLIENMKELDQLSVGVDQLEILNVKELMESIMGKHSVEFNMVGNCAVMGDKALSSVLDNIISNAIVHGDASKIDIVMQNDDTSCKISISDNGVGIPDSVKPKIFDEGYKYGKTGHTGFGLYIAKKTIERYSGSIHVEDNDPVGSTFVIGLKPARMH